MSLSNRNATLLRNVVWQTQSLLEMWRDDWNESHFLQFIIIILFYYDKFFWISCTLYKKVSVHKLWAKTGRLFTLLKNNTRQTYSDVVI